MDILILMPTEIGKQGMRKALSKFETVNNYKVVQCGIGKVESAISTTMELSARKYDAVVLSGFCGSSGEKGSTSGVAIPCKAVCYDFYHDGFDEDVDVEFTTLMGDEGVILTGDQFVNENTAKLLKSKYKDSKVYFDMESSGVCQACSAFGKTPLVIKLVADYPEDGDTIEDFRKFAETADFVSIVGFLENYFTDEI